MKSRQWYPGNMARTMGGIEADLKLVDLVVELLDARIPVSIRHPSLSPLAGTKKNLVLLHKADRAEPELTARWLSYLQRQGFQALSFSAVKPGAPKHFCSIYGAGRAPPVRPPKSRCG